MQLKYDEKGLIPVIVQDTYTKEVLTLAYMNEETLGLTLSEKRTVFYSRSRQCIWRKGETSGNIQRVVSIKADCDGDALVIEVDKNGPACHTGTESCFNEALYISDESVAQFQPMNINFGIIPPLDHRVKGKRNKNAELSQRSLNILEPITEEILK